MNDRERFHACLNYQPVDVVPHWSWGGWPETVERWIAEGYDPKTMDLTMGANRVFWVSTWFFPNPPFAHQVIEEDEKTVLYINHEGILMRERKDQPYSSMPQFVRFPVQTREEFRAFWKERMQPDLVQRVGEDWKERLQKLHNEPIPLIIVSDRWGGFFGPLRNLVGIERLCTLFYDDPAFVEEMMDANADFLIAMLEQILDAAPIDAFAFWEDMAYRSGPLLSPKLARRYMLPRYRRVVEFLQKRGVPFIGLDSDGDVTDLIPIWMDAGLNFLYPFEVQAGMDVLAVRRRFGRDLRLIGGVAKQAVAAGPEAIEKELARVKPLIDEGGYIPMLDHSCPPDISFANYAYYMRRLGEVCQQNP
jgi:uroporphyrinogen-III decarboxylase